MRKLKNIPLLYDLQERHHIKVKFVIVGTWNTVFGYLVFCLLDSLFSYWFETRYIAYMSAMVVANFINIINAYLFHRHITFNSQTKRYNMLLEFFRFSITYMTTFCLSLILLPLFTEIGHLTPKISGGIVILICVCVSYLAHSQFTFKTSPKSSHESIESSDIPEGS